MEAAQQIMQQRGVAARNALRKLTDITILTYIARTDSRVLVSEAAEARLRSLQRRGIPIKVCTKDGCATAAYTEPQADERFGRRKVRGKLYWQSQCRKCRSTGG